MSKNDLAPGSKAQLIQRILGRKTGQAASDGRMAEQSANSVRNRQMLVVAQSLLDFGDVR